MVPPPSGRLKINVDAAYSESSHEGVTGVGLRDHEGNLLRAQAIWYDVAPSALVMEAYVIEIVSRFPLTEVFVRWRLRLMLNN